MTRDDELDEFETIEETIEAINRELVEPDPETLVSVEVLVAVNQYARGDRLVVDVSADPWAGWIKQGVIEVAS